MSNIYRLCFDESFRTLVLKDVNDIEYLEPVNGLSNVSIDLEDEYPIDVGKPLGVIINFSTKGLLVSGELKKKVQTELEDCGQWKEMNYRGGLLYYFLPNLIANAIDEKNSVFRYEQGYLIDCIKLKFKELSFPYVFRIDKYSPELFCNEHFKMTLDNYSIKGFSFEKA